MNVDYLCFPTGSPYNQAASPYNQAGSPYNQAASPYDQAGSPYDQAGSPYNQMGSPPYDAHSPSPYAISSGSPGAYSMSSPEQSSPGALQYPPQYPVSVDSMDAFHAMVPFSTACTGGVTCTAASVYDPISQAPAMYSTPPLPMYVNDTCSPHQLPPFQSVFDTQLERVEPYNLESAVQIKMVPNDTYGVIDYYPPTPPTPENQLDMCPVPPPLPPHLASSFPTIPITARRSKSTPILGRLLYTYAPGVDTC